ncbi:MAG: cytochrome c oxidase assembly protein [Gammaproteobacteria bacterium]
MTTASANSGQRTAVKLAVIAVAMFGFGYAMVPIYNVLCDITGLNGKTGETSAALLDAEGVDRSRSVRVELISNVNGNLPWEFGPMTDEVSVHPGEIGEATYYVKNNSDRVIVGQAIPSVSPGPASVHFNKTECFCFTEQTLQPGELREMPVRFVINPAVSDRYKVMTLSYTFFEVPGSADRG